MATNRIDILDSALLRPGRIDRKIEFPAPGEDARLDILKIHSRKMNLTRGINLKKIAEMMPGASGAEVKGVCTEAGMYALRERRVHVTQEDFEMAVAKVTHSNHFNQFISPINFNHAFVILRSCKKTPNETCRSRSSGNKSSTLNLLLSIHLYLKIYIIFYSIRSFIYIFLSFRYIFLFEKYRRISL